MAFHYDPFSQNNQEEKKDSAPKKAVKTAGNAVKNKAKRAIAKKALKLLASALKKGIVVLGKALLAFLGSLGLPTILIIIGVVFLIIIITLVSSSIFGSGIDLDSEQQDLHDHIVEASHSTVNMDDELQASFRVPVELLSSIVQLDATQDDDHYQLVTDMAEVLAPNFIYSDQFNEWTETQTRSCKEGEDCEPWSDIDRDNNYVTKLTNVEYWRGHRTWDYTPYTTEWETTVESEFVTEIETITETYIDYETRIVENITYVPYTHIVYDHRGRPREVTRYERVVEEVEETYPVEKEREIEIEVEKEIKHYTKTRHQKYRYESHRTEDYTHLDTKLNSLGFGKNDKRLLEVNYTFQGRPMNYIEWLENGGAYNGGGSNLPMYTPYPGTILPGVGIPSEYMPYYLGGEAAFGTPWFILASIHAQETNFSTHPTMISSAGAEGHMQFMPCSWVGWAYPGCVGTKGNVYIPDSIKHNPSEISRYGGYGVDANGDGKADPWDAEDAIFAAANMLASNDVIKDPEGAIKTYNHANWYVLEVMERANKFRETSEYTPGDNAVANVISAATSWLDRSNRYVFGGGRNGSDVASGRFDCSSFVHWAFLQAGVELGPLHSVSTESLNKVGTKVQFSNIQPGDIIFFDTYKKDGHVGIWLGNGQWIGTQGSTGIAVVNQATDSYWQGVFNGHVRRVFN